MIAAGRVDVDLLHEVKIRVLVGERPGDTVKIRRQALLRPRARLRAAVHKEPVIRLIRAKADVIRHNFIGLARGDGRLHRAILYRQLLIADAVIVDQDIGHIPAHDQYQRQQDAQNNLPALFHAVLLMVYKIRSPCQSRIYPL